MNIKYLSIALSSLLALVQAKNYEFKVVSILGEGSSLGVKYGDTVKPLNATHFPLFTGSFEADKIEDYKYVSLDSAGSVIEEETINRKYKKDNVNEVYNRAEKDVKIEDLPRLFKNMYPMGADNFKPLPRNVIYNVYAKCNNDQYNSVVSEPFLGGDLLQQNNQLVNCTFTIVSPKNVFQSDGSIHLIGFGSRLFKKLTWACKFDKKFLGRKAIKLRAMASDPTLIRENVSAELYKAVGVPVQEGAYARVFINGDTYGLYTIIDSFSKKWVAGYVHGDAKKDIGISYKLYAKIPPLVYQFKKVLMLVFLLTVIPTVYILLLIVSVRNGLLVMFMVMLKKILVFLTSYMLKFHNIQISVTSVMTSKITLNSIFQMNMKKKMLIQVTLPPNTIELWNLLKSSMIGLILQINQ